MTGWIRCADQMILVSFDVTDTSSRSLADAPARQVLASQFPDVYGHGHRGCFAGDSDPALTLSAATETSRRASGLRSESSASGRGAPTTSKRSWRSRMCAASPSLTCRRAAASAGKSLVDGHYGNHDCVLFRDFRELLGRKDIDAVLIATGDRWHAAASILAAEAGKDVYSEKPCGITIADCQKLADTMHREKRIFQAGTQRRSVPNFQKAVELAHTGKLGKLQTLHASVYMPELDNTWLSAEPQPARRRRLEPVARPGGVAPVQQEVRERGWRGQWDFDSGARLLDWGRIRSTFASGQTRRTARYRSSMSRATRASFATTRTV